MKGAEYALSNSPDDRLNGPVDDGPMLHRECGEPLHQGAGVYYCTRCLRSGYPVPAD